MPDCLLCNEPVTDDDRAMSRSSHPAHRTCMLRNVLGGIGHQIAHDYWCLQRDDPDAGLTYHQSAQLVAAMADILGIDETVRRAVTT